MNFLILTHVDCEGLGLWEECCREDGIVYALQFHLEVTAHMIEAWVREYGTGLSGQAGMLESARMLEQTPARCQAVLPLDRIGRCTGGCW